MCLCLLQLLLLLLLIPIILEPLRCRIQFHSMVPLLIPIPSIRSLLLQMLLMLRVEVRLRMLRLGMMLVLMHMLGRAIVPLRIADTAPERIRMIRRIRRKLLRHTEMGIVVWSNHVHRRLGYGVC